MVNISDDGMPFDAFPPVPPTHAENAIPIDGPDFPYVVKADVGRLSDGSIGLRLTVAASEEAYQSRAWTEVAYLLGPATARELATNLIYR
jgi:hypothetical protein